MKCSTCATPIDKSLYFALEHDAHDILRLHGGYVYFWTVEDCYGEMVVKIGFTINLEQRISAFARSGHKGVVVPDTVVMHLGSLAGAISGGRRMEKALHAAFRDEHVVGEWFRYSDRIACTMDMLLDEFCADKCCSDATSHEHRAIDALTREAMEGMFSHLMGTVDGALAQWNDEIVSFVETEVAS